MHSEPSTTSNGDRLFSYGLVVDGPSDTTERTLTTDSIPLRFTGSVWLNWWNDGVSHHAARHSSWVLPFGARIDPPHQALIAHTTAAPVPFSWTATADSMLAKVDLRKAIRRYISLDAFWLCSAYGFASCPFGGGVATNEPDSSRIRPSPCGREDGLHSPQLSADRDAERAHI